MEQTTSHTPTGKNPHDAWRSGSHPGSILTAHGFNISYATKAADQSSMASLDEESDTLSVRVPYTTGEWVFGVDGLESVPRHLRQSWLDKCWASSVLPTIVPTRLLKQDQNEVEIWACSGSDGSEICSVIKYDRASASHFALFEKHFEFLLKTRSFYHMKLYGAYATASSLCIVQQAVAGTMSSIVGMKQCGPMPEPILAVTVRCVLLALSDAHKLGLVPRSIEGNVWIAADAVKLGALFDFEQLPANEDEASAALRAVLAELPRLIVTLGGTPKERQTAQNREDLWAPSGLFPDANYATMAGAMWPLRFRADKSSRLHGFLHLCAAVVAGDSEVSAQDTKAPSQAGAEELDGLLRAELVEAYTALRPGVPLQWCRVQVSTSRRKLETLESHCAFSRYFRQI